VCLAEDAVFVDPKFLARAQLTFAGIAGKAGQVVNLFGRLKTLKELFHHRYGKRQKKIRIIISFLKLVYGSFD